jgi:signal transduction histidine kinase
LFGGVGIGLAITRQVIEQHHGKLNVESKQGMGSKFTMLLPLGNGIYFPNSTLNVPSRS